MIQWSRIHELREEFGDEEFREVVDLFLEEVEEVIHRLRQAPQTAQLEEDLHFLKGSALNLGFEQFSNLCQAGEHMSAQGQADTVDLTEIIASYETSKQAFQNDMTSQFGAG